MQKLRLDYRDAQWALMARVKDHDPVAVEELLVLLRPKLEAFIRRYARMVAAHELEDLRSEALEGMLIGIQKFDVSKMARDRLPSSYILSWSVARLQRFARKSMRVAGKELQVLDGPGDEEDREEVLPREEPPTTSAVFAHLVMRDYKARLMAELTPLEAQVIELRLFQPDDVRPTLTELGERIGYSREWVRIVEDGAKAKMREALKRLTKEEAEDLLSA